MLWQILHRRCLPAARAGGAPTPCARLVPGVHGYVLLRDRRGKAQYLLMPTARMIGIESPALLAPGATPYFARAWAWRDAVGRTLGRALPREDIALAVNSRYARTQNQLHIHIDCVDASVRKTLDRWQSRLDRHWQWLPRPLKGQRYRAIAVDGAALRVDPFAWLARTLPRGSGMGSHTLVVVGTRFSGGRPGFLILDGPVNLARHEYGSGEALQDHDCAIAGVDAGDSTSTADAHGVHGAG